MAYTFEQLQEEVARRGTINQSGDQFTEAIKNIINTSLFRISREANWRQMRRKSYFTTDADYSTGTGSVTVTNGSKNVSVTGATFITNRIKIGRRVQLGGSTLSYVIRTITGETTFTVDKNYNGTSSSSQSYKIYGTEEYNLPIQSTHRMFVWHEAFGYPYRMYYITDLDYYDSGVAANTSDIPTHYRMWGENMILSQPLQASVMRVSSSSSADTSKPITIFGTVGGYPDYEIINTNSSNGTTAVSGLKSFTSVDRVSKSDSTTGLITVDSNSAGVTIAVIPANDITNGVQYSKIQLYPLPQTQFDINVEYYKEPYRLVNNGDVNELGQEFDEAIILLSTAKIKFEQNQKEAESFLALYQDELRNLKKNNSEKFDYIPGLRKPKNSRKNINLNRMISYNQLGGSYGPMGYY